MTGFEIPLLIAGMAISAAGALSAGAAAKREGEFNAAVGQANARAARRDSAENARRQDRLNRKRLSTFRNTESVSLDLLEDNVMEATLQSLDILHAGEVRALGFESGAKLDRLRGAGAQRSSQLSAAGTLLKGGAVFSQSSFFGSPAGDPSGATQFGDGGGGNF